MATIRPEASETTGTLRETSGATVPVTTNTEVVGCALASTSGNCSGRSTAKRFRSTSGTMFAGGGASAAASTCPLQPPSISDKTIKARTRRRAILRFLFFMGTSGRRSATTNNRHLHEISRRAPPRLLGDDIHADTALRN